MKPWSTMPSVIWPNLRIGCIIVSSFHHKPQTKRTFVSRQYCPSTNLDEFGANSMKCKFRTIPILRSGLIEEKRSGETSEVLGKSDRGRKDAAAATTVCPEYSIMQTRLHSQISHFQFSSLFVFWLKANCQLDDLDWIWEPVEPVACNSENNLLPPDVVVRLEGNQPPRHASLEIANFIFRHEIQLRGTHSENFSDYWSNCDDNNIGVVLSSGKCRRAGAKATWMRERDRIWTLNLHSTFNYILHWRHTVEKS